MEKDIKDIEKKIANQFKFLLASFVLPALPLPFLFIPIFNIWYIIFAEFTALVLSAVSALVSLGFGVLIMKNGTRNRWVEYGIAVSVIGAILLLWIIFRFSMYMSSIQ